MNATNTTKENPCHATNGGNAPLPHWYRQWLVLCIILVVSMVALGGVTRLTESGLSIVEWKLLSGTFPPLSHEAWVAEFEAYQATPEYQQINKGFGIDGFKRIFWLEYLHRLLGRIVGLVFIIPLIYAATTRAVPRRTQARMLGFTALVGVQGVIGWVMVASGLHEDPRVHPIKLALHLSTAFTLFSLLLWEYWRVTRARYSQGTLLRGKGIAIDAAVQNLSTSSKDINIITGSPQSLTRLRENGSITLPRFILPAAWGVLALTALQIILGAIVAGMDAGLSYNTYPLMDGKFIPNGLMMLEPWWRNSLENITMIQFQHRMGALTLSAAIITFASLYYNTLNGTLKRPITLLVTALIIQFALGVATLIYVVPISLGSLHQLAALGLLAAILHVLFTLRLVNNAQKLA